MIHLESSEHLVTKIRKHWFILFGKTLALIFLVVAPFLAFYFLSYNGLLNKVASLGGGLAFTSPELLGLFVYLIWLLASTIMFFIFWTDYYLDIWVVTNERVIAIEQNGVFSRTTTSFRLEQIQDISVKMNGVIPTLLNFGTLHVHTAGQKKDISLRGARNPQQAKQIIYQGQSKNKMNSSQSTKTVEVVDSDHN